MRKKVFLGLKEGWARGKVRNPDGGGGSHLGLTIIFYKKEKKGWCLGGGGGGGMESEKSFMDWGGKRVASGRKGIAFGRGAKEEKR